MWFHDHKCHDFWSRFAHECQTFALLPGKKWQGLAPMGQQEPAPLHSITHQTYMVYIQGSGGREYGFMTTNAMTLVQICS
jgi:hypothetical protein